MLFSNFGEYPGFRRDGELFDATQVIFLSVAGRRNRLEATVRRRPHPQHTRPGGSDGRDQHATAHTRKQDTVSGATLSGPFGN